jgi:hypothetical protein
MNQKTPAVQKLENMNALAIESLNLAVSVMRHFIELSAKLLPYYEKATRNNALKANHLEVEQKLAAVYEKYDVDPSSSEFLMNSEIIGYIQKGYDAIKKRHEQGEEQVKHYMTQFTEEYNTLKQRWEMAALN